MSLTGTYLFQLDAKHRLVVPACFRPALGEPIRLTAGPEATVLLLPRGVRHRLEVRLTFQQPLDATTGRVLIPPALREWAGLRAGQEVAVCGAGRHVAVLPWARCLGALRERKAAGAVPWDLPTLAALQVENRRLREELERLRAFAEALE